MLESFAGAPVLVGAALGLSLAAPPGPVNALMLSRTARQGFLPGVAVGGGATAGDAVLCTLMALGAVRVLEAVPTLGAFIALAGGALMVFFAWNAFQSARALGEGLTAPDEDAGLRRTGLAAGFGTGVSLALTSPYNYAWWASTGTALFDSFGLTVFIGFFAGILAWCAFFAGTVTWARDRAAGVVRVVSYASAGLLLVFAVGLVAHGMRGLGVG